MASKTVTRSIQWSPTTAKTTILLLLLLLLLLIIIIIIMVYLTHPRGGFPVKIHYLQLKINKNALSSVESRLLGDILLPKAPVLLHYFFIWNTKRVLYVIM